MKTIIDNDDGFVVEKDGIPIEKYYRLRGYPINFEIKSAYHYENYYGAGDSANNEHCIKSFAFGSFARLKEDRITVDYDREKLEVNFYPIPEGDEPHANFHRDVVVHIPEQSFKNIKTLIDRKNLGYIKLTLAAHSDTNLYRREIDKWSKHELDNWVGDGKIYLVGEVTERLGIEDFSWGTKIEEFPTDLYEATNYGGYRKAYEKHISNKKIKAEESKDLIQTIKDISKNIKRLTMMILLSIFIALVVYFI